MINTETLAYVVFIAINTVIFTQYVNRIVRFGKQYTELKKVSLQNLHHVPASSDVFDVKVLVVQKKNYEIVYQNVTDDEVKYNEHDMQVFLQSLEPIKDNKVSFVHIPDMEETPHLIAVSKSEDDARISIAYIDAD